MFFRVEFEVPHKNLTMSNCDIHNNHLPHTLEYYVSLEINSKKTCIRKRLDYVLKTCEPF